eukprot:461787-Pyramimonas_sp.AAC.1
MVCSPGGRQWLFGVFPVRPTTWAAPGVGPRGGLRPAHVPAACGHGALLLLFGLRLGGLELR